MDKLDKLKEVLKKAREWVLAHKTISMSVAGAVAVVAVTGIIIAVVLGSHSSTDTVAGGETSEETMATTATVVMETQEETTEETESSQEDTPEEEDDDTSMEFEYEGKKIVISTDKPVELIPEAELEKKVEKDKSTTNIGANVQVDNPGSSNSKETEKKEDYEIVVDEDDKDGSIYEGDAYAPLSGVSVGELYNSASKVGFTITDESGNVVKKMTSEEVDKYSGNPEDITVVFDKAGTYNIHYEYLSPGVNITEAVHGIDVSHWQNNIDWGKVAAAGYKFAMIKVAGRSIAEDGNLYEDDYFRQNIEQATAHGIKVGVYFFSQALSVKEAYEEASYILNLIKGYNITYPVVFDWETASGYRTCDKLNKQELTSICEAFCDTVKSHGYQPMIYMSKNDWVNKVYTNTLASKYNVWLAWYFYKYYNSSDNRLYQDGDEVPDLNFNYNIWQYTSTGRVDGIDGYCDMNVAFATAYKPGDTVTKDTTVKVIKKKEQTTTAPDKSDKTEGTTSATTAPSATTGSTETTTGTSATEASSNNSTKAATESTSAKQ